MTLSQHNVDRLRDIARELIDGRDAAHDFEHAYRVMKTALSIGDIEGGDAEVLVPAALFHDVVMYPKDDPRSSEAASKSAEIIANILNELPEYPKSKIEQVTEAIINCSFGNTAVGLPLDALIIQDADRLEATGAIAVMRTFWSAGQMKHPLYHPKDPTAQYRKPDGLEYALDLFWTRLLRVEGRMNTRTGRQLAQSRTEFLRSFIEQFDRELRVTIPEYDS